jgi:tryptophanyl-tRNA synthetase
MDSPELVKRKIWNAFTGGKGTATEQRKTGADPTVCSVFQYYFYLFEEEDKKLAERERKCKAGEILCGECKTDLVARLNKFLGEHRKKREKAKDVIENYHIKR